MAGSATPTRWLAIATGVALLAGGCSRSEQAASTGSIDPMVLEMVAPVGGASLRTSEELRERVAKAAYERWRECMEGLGNHNLAPFRWIDERVFDLPDAENLRRFGFEAPRPAGAHEPTEDDFEQGPNPEDGATCQDREPPDPRMGPLAISWIEAALPLQSRPEEAELWSQAAACMELRGYPKADLDSEKGFVLSLDRLAFAATSFQERQLIPIANDYVDCTEPVWVARTKAAEALRGPWAEEHDEELRALSDKLKEEL